MKNSCTLTFNNNLTAHIVQVHSPTALTAALHQLGLDQPRPTLALVGGASKISESDKNDLRRIFLEVIAPLAEQLGVVVVDGGTDAGIMQFIGQARTRICGTFPLIGVAAIGTVMLPGVKSMNADAAMLEPNHTHFVLVPGCNWGDESPWLSEIGSHLAKGLPSVTIVVNGGEITWQDVAQSVKAKRPAIVLAGSGRTADKLAAALQGEVTDERATDLVASGLLHAIDVSKDAAALAHLIGQMLSRPADALPE